MIELECKECGTMTECDETTVSVTCARCVQVKLYNMVQKEINDVEYTDTNS